MARVCSFCQRMWLHNAQVLKCCMNLNFKVVRNILVKENFRGT